METEHGVVTPGVFASRSGRRSCRRIILVYYKIRRAYVRNYSLFRITKTDRRMYTNSSTVRSTVERNLYILLECTIQGSLLPPAEQRIACPVYFCLSSRRSARLLVCCNLWLSHIFKL